MNRFVSLGSYLLLQSSSALAADQLLGVGFEDCDATYASEVYRGPSSWSELTGWAWPAPIGNAFALEIPSGRVISLAFTAGTGTAGSIELAERAGLPSAPAALSISTCMADFRVSVLNDAVHRCLAYNGTIQPKLFWRNGEGNAGACGLIAGQRYFLNIAYYAIPLLPDAPPTCIEESCGSWILSRNL